MHISGVDSLGGFMRCDGSGLIITVCGNGGGVPVATVCWVRNGGRDDTVKYALLNFQKVSFPVEKISQV